MADRKITGGQPPRRAEVYVATCAITLSVFAVSIVTGNVAAGAPRETDENTWAHLFQIAMAAQLPLLLLFFAIADWTQRKRLFILLGAQILAAGAAFTALAWSGY